MPTPASGCTPASGTGARLPHHSACFCAAASFFFSFGAPFCPAQASAAPALDAPVGRRSCFQQAAHPRLLATPPLPPKPKEKYPRECPAVAIRNSLPAYAYLFCESDRRLAQLSGLSLSKLLSQLPRPRPIPPPAQPNPKPLPPTHRRAAAGRADGRFTEEQQKRLNCDEFGYPLNKPAYPTKVAEPK